MPVEFGIWRIDGATAKLPTAKLPDEKKLEDLLESEPDVVGLDVIVLGRQVPTAHGGFIDLVAMDPRGNLKDGPMQDVHWPSGAFGYFPSYTLGAMMAAQQWAAIIRENPNANADIAKGDFTFTTDWRRKNIWSKASTASTPELMQQATGEPLNARYFIQHVQQRYG